MTFKQLFEQLTKHFHRHMRETPADPSLTYVRSIPSGLFSPETLSWQEKAQVFTTLVKLIEFEPHAFCNRTCQFCPNSFIDRQKNHTVFDMALFQRIIIELAQLGYKQTIKFSRYCEPLALPELNEYLAFARKHLQTATLEVVTNGDYLQKNLLADLAEAGLSRLLISIYPVSAEWTREHAIAQMTRIAEKIDVTPVIIEDSEDYLRWQCPHDRVEIIAQAQNLMKRGYDRANSLPSFSDREFTRISPCLFVFSHLMIDYNGKLVLCCKMRSDYAPHLPFVIADLSQGTTLLEGYFHETFTKFRTHLISIKPKMPPCRTCKQRSITNQATLAQIEEIVSQKFHVR